jgi:hypothetical protein
VEYVVSAMLVVVAIIHLTPLTGVLGRERLEALYGIPIAEPNLLILMRHRAVLFGVLGVFFLAAAFIQRLQMTAFVAGFASVVPFLWLAWPIGRSNAHVARVFRADVVGLLCLVVGVIAYAIPAAASDAAEDNRAAEQQRLDAACEAAREQKLEPERARFVLECVQQQMKSTLEECERFYGDYGARTGNRAPLYYDLPECVAAFEYRQSYRQ